MFVKKAIYVALVALVVLSFEAAVQAIETIPVFVFAGQSNANGFGIPSQLPVGLQQSQANVLFDNAYVNATPAWAPLQAPTEPGSRYNFGGQYNIDYVNGAFGPELTTGLGISKAMGGKQVAEVKYSVGGTSLASDWNPAATEGNMCYSKMVSAVNTAVAKLQIKNPDKLVQIQGFFWMQGENDTDGSTYQNNLTNFIARVRTDFGNPNLPFVIGQLGAAWTGNAIAQAQANIGTPRKSTYVHDTLMVATADLPVIFDNMHFNTTGVQKLGDRYAAAFETLTGLPVHKLSASVADANLLNGKPVVISTTYSGFTASDATDGTASQHVFADNDSDMRLVVHGFNSRVKQIRIWRDMSDVNRVPAKVTIMSSTSKNTLLTNRFETTLVTSLSLGNNAFVDGYSTINVDAPEGTQSLFFDFGDTDSLGNAHGVRIMEIQAMAIPEPSAITMIGGGLGGLWVYAWRKKK